MYNTTWPDCGYVGYFTRYVPRIHKMRQSHGPSWRPIPGIADDKRSRYRDAYLTERYSILCSTAQCGQFEFMVFLKQILHKYAPNVIVAVWFWTLMLLGRPSRVLRTIWPNQQIRPFQNDERVLRTTFRSLKKKKFCVLCFAPQPKTWCLIVDIDSLVLGDPKDEGVRQHSCLTVQRLASKLASKLGKRCLPYCADFVTRSSTMKRAITWSWIQFPVAANLSQTWLSAVKMQNFGHAPGIPNHLNIQSAWYF